MLCQKHDADGNPIDRLNQNPIEDTHLYEVDFPRGKMTELVANIIAESMYSQCDVDVNEYPPLEAFVNHRKKGSALSVEVHKVFIKGEKLLESQQLVGTFVANGQTDPNNGRTIKELHPIQVALYAIAQGIEYEPALTGVFIMS